MAIKSIGGEDVHRITSGQVITDIATAVKELVENALDANTTQIEVHFKNYGLDGLEVSDNGGGISEEDFSSIARKHYTSKIGGFEDLETVQTLGFRGEALSSLCAIAQLKITTTQSPPKATLLSFTASGEVSEKRITTRNRGTTVAVSELFHNLPVRKKDFLKNHKREFNRCLSLLQDYTLIHTKVKFMVYNTTQKGKKTLVLSSQGSGLLKNNVISVYGANGMYGLVPLDLTLDLNEYRSKLKMTNVHHDYKIHMTGLISKTSFGYGRSATDRQVLYINKRPVELRSFTKMINEVYRSYNNIQYPVIIGNLEMDTQFIDVNVTPDKRTILIHNEVYVIEELRQALTAWFDSHDISIPRNMDGQRSIELLKEEKKTIDPVEETNQLSKRALRFAYNNNPDLETGSGGDNMVDSTPVSKRDDKEAMEHEASTPSHSESSDGIDDDIDLQGSRKRPSDTQLVQAAQKRVEEFLSEEELKELNEIEPFAEIIEPQIEEDDDEEEDGIVLEEQQEAQELVAPPTSRKQRNRTKVIDLSQLSAFRNGSNTTPSAFNVLQKRHDSDCHCHRKEEEEEEEEEDESDSDNELQEEIYHSTGIPLRSTPQTELESEAVKDPSLDEGKEDDGEIELMKVTVKKEHVMHETTASVPLEFAQFATQSEEPHDQKLDIDDISNQEESENYLTLTVSKSDFSKMKIIGQFNLGFILVIRENEGKQDLFIVDQHASDEKYNFEDLQKNTVFDSQRLVIPQTLELNVLDELVVMDHSEVFEKNGFQLKVNEEAEPGERVKLVSLPLSKRTAFDTSDFNELVHLVKENPGNTSSIRCSKIRSMFAMRACRKSIMIGKHLSFKTMTRLVRNLGTLDKPWNCPHGRPTMRHLIELQQWKPFNEDYAL